MGSIGSDCNRGRRGRMCVMTVCCINSGSGSRDGSLMAQFAPLVRMYFSVVVLESPFLVVVIPHTLSVLDNPMSELYEDTSCGNNRDLPRSIRKWYDSLADQVLLFGLCRHHLAQSSIAKKEKIRIAIAS